jgi:hypothetical protein
MIMVLLRNTNSILSCTYMISVTLPGSCIFKCLANAAALLACLISAIPKKHKYCYRVLMCEKSSSEVKGLVSCRAVCGSTIAAYIHSL